MIFNLSHALNDLSTRYHAQGQLARITLLSIFALLMAGAAAFAFRPAPMADLAEGHQLRRADFFALWAKGDLVVLMRHVERCDHSTNPCMAEPDGITHKGQAVASELGHSLRTLGLDQADIYNSPLLRTQQTSVIAFNRTSSGQDWLINCRKTLLADMLKHKLDQRNLVLVTHSECINALEKTLHVRAPKTLDYGASMIVHIDPNDHSAKVLGYIDAEDWGAILAKRP